MCEIRPAEPLRVSRVARFIGSLLEFGGFAVIGGGIGRLAQVLVPHKEAASIATLAGLLGAVLVFLFNQHLHRAIGALQKWFRFGERIAPYFGHRIENAYRVLRS